MQLWAHKEFVMVKISDSKQSLQPPSKVYGEFPLDNASCGPRKETAEGLFCRDGPRGLETPRLT